jgi:hypothetical protein
VHQLALALVHALLLGIEQLGDAGARRRILGEIEDHASALAEGLGVASFEDRRALVLLLVAPPKGGFVKLYKDKTIEIQAHTADADNRGRDEDDRREGGVTESLPRRGRENRPCIDGEPMASDRKSFRNPSVAGPCTFLACHSPP